jgi:E3 ubiquitin-protein ligase BRE1
MDTVLYSLFIIAEWNFAQTIGQAYEDMQTQNQRLLQQISERDDYNLKVRMQYQFCVLAFILMIAPLKHVDVFSFLTISLKQLIYESFKTKQVYASLIEQKQILTNRLKQINTLGDCFKQRAARLEEHVCPK